ncbi:hypothetical protein ACP6JD_005902 [Aspergillus fumigatus]
MTNSTSTSKPRVIVDPQTLSQRRTTRPRTQAQITDIRQTKEYKVAARRKPKRLGRPSTEEKEKE